jgi:hypothetical protein
MEFNKKRPIRSLLRPLFPSVAVFVKTLGLVYSRRSMLRQRGYVESSKRKRACRRDGSPLPWMNYHVIQFLEERLSKDLSLFEYGSGTSTGFYAALVKDVVSVETDPGWYTEVKASMPGNVELIRFDSAAGERYAEVAERQGRKFDVIVVDAIERTECLLEAPKALTERGVIVLDDSDPEGHRQGIESLKKQGFREFLFEGLKPGSIQAYRTSVFYRDGNCLRI